MQRVAVVGYEDYPRDTLVSSLQSVVHVAIGDHICRGMVPLEKKQRVTCSCGLRTSTLVVALLGVRHVAWAKVKLPGVRSFYVRLERSLVSLLMSLLTSALFSPSSIHLSLPMGYFSFSQKRVSNKKIMRAKHSAIQSPTGILPSHYCLRR